MSEKFNLIKAIKSIHEAKEKPKQIIRMYAYLIRKCLIYYSPFIFFDKKIRKRIKDFLKDFTTLDFSDWGVLGLLFGGLFSIAYIEKITEWIYFVPNVDLTKDDKISGMILWLTAMIIMQYTKETYWLKQVNIKQLKFLRAPFVILHYQENNDGKRFILKNVGKGVARNVKLRPVVHQNLKEKNIEAVNFTPKTVIAPDEGWTITEPVITPRMNKKTGEEHKDAIRNTIIEAIKPKFGRNIDLKIEIIYQDAYGSEHKTILSTSEFQDGYIVIDYK